MSGQHHAAGDPDTAVQRMPALGAFEIHSETGPRMVLLHQLPHGCGVEAELREPDQSVEINPCVASADMLLGQASALRRILRHAVHPEIGAGYPFAQLRSRKEVEEAERL